MKLTTGTSAQRTATTSRETPFSGDPITAAGAATEGLRPSGAGGPICACGCDRQIVGRRSGARYATDACKSRAWRASTGYRLSASRRRVRHDKSGRSGLQVSYEKAVRLVALAMIDDGYVGGPDRALRARLWAETVVKDGLSETQRARLDEREAA